MDPLAGAIVSLFIARMGVQLTIENLFHLLDRLTSKDLALVDQLTTIANDVTGMQSMLLPVICTCE